MRWTVVVLSFAALVGTSMADDAPPKPAAPKVVTMSADAWQAAVAAVEADPKLDGGTRVQRLRALASTSLVEVRRRIREIRMDVDGAHPSTIIACGLYDGADVQTFPVAEVEVPIVEEWRRWDRLTWRVRPRVNDAGEIRFEMATPLGSFTRTPNPGFEPRPQSKKTGDHGAFMKWINLFARAAYSGDEITTREVWSRGCEKTWLFASTVHAVDAAGIAVRLDEDGYIEVKKMMVVGTAYDGTPIRQEKAIARWGWGPNDDVLVTTDDPQAVALLTPGTRVNVAVDLKPGTGPGAQGGTFQATVRPWKIKGKK